jgi:polyisoprenyl-phosphate glycosyltransferase
MKNFQNIKVSFVIACYNSENSLKAVVVEVIDALEKLGVSYEIILVNDGSKDGTIEVIKNLCKANFSIKAINLSRNFGQQNAMLAGFNHASGDLVAYCDDDGQSPVNEVHRFVSKIDEGYDMVWAKYPDEKRSFLNTIGANLNNRMLKYLFNKPLDLGFGNLWLAKHFIIKEAIKCKNPRVYLGGVFLTISKNMANVDCEKRDRFIGESNYSLMKLIIIWLNGLTAFSIAPLRVASLTGGLVSVIGFFYMLYLIAYKLIYGDVLIGYSSLMSVILFIGGMLMLMIGILGEYIGRIYSNLNSLPQFVVKQKINLDND